MSKLRIRPSSTPVTDRERTESGQPQDGWRAWVVEFICNQCGRRATEEIVGERDVVANYYHLPICETCRTGEIP
jgi:hypothetical protein